MPNDDLHYKVKANDFLFFLSRNEIEKADFIKISPDRYHLIKDHQNIIARICETDSSGKKLEVEIGGDVLIVDISDELDQVLEQMGFSSGTAKQAKEIKAPMPGQVLEIAVVNGQDVNEGDKLLILEAMKMENIITSHSPAKIKCVVVKAGQAVEKGQVLLELE